MKMRRICSLIGAAILLSFASFASFDQLVQELNEATRTGDSKQVESIIKRMYSNDAFQRESLLAALSECINMANNNGHQLIADRLQGLYEVNLLEETYDADDEIGEYSDDFLDEGDEGDEGDPFDLSFLSIIETSSPDTMTEDAEDICDYIRDGHLPDTLEENDKVCEFLRNVRDTPVRPDLTEDQPEIDPEVMRQMIEAALSTLQNLKY